MKRQQILLVFLCVGVCYGVFAEEKIIDFVKGKWDPAKWQPILVAPQKKIVKMIQKTDCIGNVAFSKEDIKKGLDNVVEIYDTGKPDGEFHLEFKIGSKSGTAPGIVLWPELKDKSLRKGIGVFVASYCMAVWEIGFDEKKNAVTYKHLARIGRYQDPTQKHVLRCRFAKNGGYVLQIDDSDYLIMRQKEIKPNNFIGLWGCHGICDFYKIKFPKPSLPFGGVSNPKQK